jgi:DNA-binding MarR family transcriptional regulator
MICSIGQSIRQGRPFRSRETEALVALLCTADRVGDEFERALRPHGLSMQQYNVLRILRGAGPEGLRTCDVVSRMVSRAPNITRLVDKLEDKRLVARRRSEGDRRAIRLRITAAGRRLVASLDDTVAAADARAMRGLTPRELGTLTELLDRLRSPLEDEDGVPEARRATRRRP